MERWSYILMCLLKNISITVSLLKNAGFYGGLYLIFFAFSITFWSLKNVM